MPQQPPSTVRCGKPLADREVLLGEPDRIAVVEDIGLVELGVALRRRVRPNPENAVPRPRPVENGQEVRRVGAVDHEVRRRGIRLGIDLLDRLGKGLTGREPPVGLDGEGHRDGETMLRRGPDDADRLVDVRDRERGRDVGGRFRENADLPRVVCLRLVGGHPTLGVVGIALGPDRRAEDDRSARGLLALADPGHEPDRPPVRLGEIVERVAELRAPRGIRAPGVRLEHEADPVAPRDLEVRLEVAVHRRPSVVPLEERERREAREVETVAEDQRRLHPTVGEQHVPVQLWQRLAVAHGANRMTRRMAVQRSDPPYTRLMREHDLELLELPAVLARLAAAAASEPGALLAEGLRPSPDAEVVHLRQQQTTEAIALLDDAAEPDLGGVADVTEAAERAARGSTLDTRSLSLIERTIRAGTAGRRALTARDDLPALQALTAGIEVSLLSVAEEIGRAVEEDGSDLKDSASPGCAACAASCARVAGSSPSGCARSRAIRRSPSTSRTTSSPSAAAVPSSRSRRRRADVFRGSCTTRPARGRRSSSSPSLRSTTRTGSVRPRSLSVTRWRGFFAISRRSSPARQSR